MIKIYDADGHYYIKVGPQKNTTKFPPSCVQEGDSLTIREMYKNWVLNRPTSVHPLADVFDDYDDSDEGFNEGDYTEYIDRSQVENDINNAAKTREDLERTILESKQKKTAKKKEEQTLTQ